MKKNLVFAIMICLAKISNAQNFLSNPSFEDYSQCPDANDQVVYCVGWEAWCATPEYCNGCTAIGPSVPHNGGGFQFAATGEAYCGFYTYFSPTYVALHPKNIRENIASQLSSPLSIGNTYFISIKMNLSNNSTCASNNIGVKFTTQSYAQYAGVNDSFATPLTNNFAQLYSLLPIYDTLNWVELSGSFVADSAYQYVVIGNFFDDAHTDTPIITAPPCYAYYYVDDVCVTSNEGVGCGVTGIGNVREASLNLYPNPAFDMIYFSGSSELFRSEVKMLKILSVTGNVVLLFKNLTSQSIDVSKLPSGAYEVELLTGKNIFHKKFIKQ